jgi:response regulator of citrate/malate metabolism
MAAAKNKGKGITLQLTQWCLDVLVETPDQDEVDQVAQYLVEHRDVQRLPNVIAAATFSLMVRYPATGTRHFSNDEIEMLTRRNGDVIQSALDALPDVSAKVAAAIAAVLSPKTPTKKVK